MHSVELRSYPVKSFFRPVLFSSAANPSVSVPESGLSAIAESLKKDGTDTSLFGALWDVAPELWTLAIQLFLGAACCLTGAWGMKRLGRSEKPAIVQNNGKYYQGNELCQERCNRLNNLQEINEKTNQKELDEEQRKLLEELLKKVTK